MAYPIGTLFFFGILAIAVASTSGFNMVINMPLVAASGPCLNISYDRHCR